MKTIFEFLIDKKPKQRLKVSKYDDRMMEDGTLNTNHPTLKSPYMSDREFNARQCTEGSFG